MKPTSTRSRVVSFFHSTGGRYAAALLALGSTLALIVILQQIYVPKSPSYGLILLIGLMAGAWYGYGPGILALAIAAFGVPYLFSRDFKPAQTDFKNLGLLFIISLLISRISSIRDRVEASLRKSNEELDQRVRQRTVELEHANAEAHQRLAELENLYVTAPIGLGLVDTELRYLRVNERLAAIHGVRAPAHAGRTIHELLPAAMADRLAPLYRQVLESGEPILAREVEGISRAAPGVTRTWLVSYSPVRTEQGAMVGVQVLVQDITERKQFEEQLLQTQKLESLGVLAGGIAHDFNNLLVGILGNASLALEILPGDSEVRPIIGDAVAASERAAQLTRQMLAYSGKGRFIIEAVDISKLIRETLPLIQSSIPRTVQLQLNLDKTPSIAEIDVAQIQQLVMNLVINGAEAIATGQPGVVTIAVAERDVNEDRKGRYVCIEVRDNGIGMHESTRARIFDPFFTTKFTGRGLGLAAVSGIVRGHKGYLQVVSSPGQGSTFRVLLPAVAREAAEEPDVDRSRTPAFGSGTILVVDDESVVREVARQALQRCGYTVLLAENGEIACDIFRRRADEIRLVLLDMTMPVMSGEKTFLELKKIRPDVLVLLSSGYNQVEAIQRFSGQALAAFLQKPYSSAELADQIGRALAGASLTAGSSQ